MRDEVAIETFGLTKVYGKRIGCKGVTLSVRAGELFGFLGPNGAGKSTFVKILVGLLRPTSGEARILGKRIGDIEARKRIGFLPENFRYHEWLTGEEVLYLHAALFGIPKRLRSGRVAEVTELVNLRGSERVKVRAYSKGMQQRLGMGVALLPDPDVLFLDEPTSALDPLGRREIRELLLRLKRSGKTVFLNSHLLDEVEKVCDRVAVIRDGQIIRSGPLRELLQRGFEVTMKVGGMNDGILSRMREICDSVEWDGQGGTVKAVVEEEETIPRLAEIIVREGARLYEMKRSGMSLEDFFVSVIDGSAHPWDQDLGAAGPGLRE